MNLKSAALFAFAGTILLTVLLLSGLMADLIAVARGLLPAMHLATDLIYALASIAVTNFFYTFHKSQS